ncbi:MAG: hypothetical protein F2534_12910 [Actinobacteria bacterium]|nr:hypothetical protein [Actinomycetota bacterium]
MAYVDIVALRRSIVAQLAEIMPTNWLGKPVPVDYAWPGSDLQQPLHVWVFSARCESRYDAMGAGTKRRDQTWTVDVVIEAIRKDPTLDRSGRNVMQAEVDAAVMQVFGVIDDWIAADPKLGQTSTSDVHVDFATLTAFTLEQGLPDVGATARGTCTISARIRPK